MAANILRVSINLISDEIISYILSGKQVGTKTENGKYVIYVEPHTVQDLEVKYGYGSYGIDYVKIPGYEPVNAEDFEKKVR